MKPLAKNAVAVRGSGIREIMNLAFDMEDVLHVEVGEPDFPTPPHIVEAAHRAAMEGYTRYTANSGILSVRQAISEKLERVNGLVVSPERITVTHGAVSGLMEVTAALVEPGDEVLLPDPGWPNYEMMVRIMGATPVFYRLEADRSFLPDLEAVSRLVTPRTKVIFINSPSNPTGAVFSPELVEQLLRLAEEHDLWVVSDEVYEQMVWEGEHVSAARFDRDGRVIGVFSFSKTYSMTGWRVGYIVTPPGITPVVNKMQEPMVSCATAVSQKAAEAALRGPQDCVEEMRLAYKRRCDLLVGLLREHEMFTYAPQGAFYAMVDISRGTQDTYGFARRLLLDHHVAVAPGEAFGPSGKGFVRVALCAADKTIRAAVDAIAREVRAPTLRA